MKHDKSEWGEGPWQDEPDKLHWVDPVSDLDCLIVRGPSGALCGYVGVPEGHPAFEKGVDDVGVRVHGGLTYADFCAEEDQEHGICHVPLPGRPERVWWLGFDCAHAGDLMPKWERAAPSLSYGTYKDLSYVKQQTEALALQLKG